MSILTSVVKRLTDEDVIRVMREEHDRRMQRLAEAVDLSMNVQVNGEEKPALSPGLKVRHRASQVRYTVQSVSPRDVILKTPEGEEFIVDAGELEREYELD